MRAEKRKQMAQQVSTTQPVNINYGHDDQLVLVLFSVPVKHLSLSVEQADSMIRGIEEAKRLLAEHRVKKVAS
jgi:hypothetical protein